MLPGGDELFVPCSSESLSDSISISKGSWQLAHTSADIIEGKFEYEKYSRLQTSKRILSNRDFFSIHLQGSARPPATGNLKDLGNLGSTLAILICTALVMFTVYFDEAFCVIQLYGATLY